MIIRSINIQDVNDDQLRLWFEQMDEEKKSSVSLMQNEHKRKQRICADALCRNTLSDFCGIDPDKICFELSPDGKPYAKNLAVHFSISHSGDFAVCAVSETETGIDIEKKRSVHPRVCEKFCTEAETDYVHTCENGLFEIWTLKEAYFKCIGTGLGSDIKNISFSVENNKISCSEKGFEFSFVEIDKNYICSVCKKAAR